MYTKKEIEEFKEFLSLNTTYDVNLLFSTKSIYQIASMCKNIKAAMKKYPQEIIEYLNLHPEVSLSLEDSDIYTMTYNELVNLRKKLGIKSSRKKVIKSEPAGIASQLSIDFVESQKTSQLCVSIIQNDEEKDLQILSDDEIKEMYSDEELTPEDLAKRGIVSDTIKYQEPIKDDREEERFIMIDTILESKISIGGKEVTFDFLCSLGEDELKNLQNVIQLFNNRHKRSLKK